MATSSSATTVKKSVNNQGYVSLYDLYDPSDLTWKNRTNNYYTYQDIARVNALKDGFTSVTDITKFFALKKRDYQSEELIEPDFAPGVNLTAKLTSEEAAIYNAVIEDESAKEFIQMFLDSYMSPVGSDISYRLGDVVGTKNYFYDNWGSVLHQDAPYYGQYDVYGRIDTTVNLRMSIEYQGLSFVFPRYREYYVNWFFPPYTNKAFEASGQSLSELAEAAKKAVANRKWVKDYYTTDPKTNKQVLVPGHWEYQSTTETDLLDNITYDPSIMKSLRPNPTYRTAAFKAVNDNINLLQKVFENISGVVSTYLTEWDISLYIQEGLLSDRQQRRPSLLSICNRITKDNPSGYTTSSAFCYGVLNAAVSKTPLEGIVPNMVSWEPSCYPLSTYWTPYTSINRGDGLDVFWSRALRGFQYNSFVRKNIKDKIRHYDELGAAFAGWYNWNDLRMWQVLYTCSDDSIGPIDITHLNMAPGETYWVKQGNTDGILDCIYDSICDNDSSIGWPNGTKEESWYDSYYTYTDTYVRNRSNGDWVFSQRARTRLSDGKVDYLDKNGNSSNGLGGYSSSSAGDISVMGVTISGSSLLKMFLKRSSIQNSVMNIANKAKKGGTTKATSSKSKSSNTGSNNSTSSSTGNSANGSTNETDNGYTSNTNGTSINMLDVDPNEAGKTANQLGIPQWTPALYGGPHGACYSPNTLQGYFEKDNVFLRNIPRINNSLDLYTNNMNSFFWDKESFYSATSSSYNTTKTSYRSPSKMLSLLTKGSVDYITYPINCLQRYYCWRKSSWGSPYGVYRYIRGCSWEWTYGHYAWNLSSCPNVHWWSNYWYYYNSNRRYYRDYWGWYRCLCFWDDDWSSWWWCSWWSYRHDYHGRVYMLKYALLEVWYFWEYWVWVTMYYKRALMHSDTSIKWNITKSFTYSYYSYSYYWDSWSGFYGSWARRWWGWTPMYMVYAVPISTYRLTFPYSSTYTYHYTRQGNDYRKSYAEQQFIENVLGNSTTATDWHNVFFCVSNGDANRRFNLGPDSIVQYRVRLRRFSYVAWHWVIWWSSYRCRHRRRWRRYWVRHWYYWWELEPHTYTGEFIEVDVQNSSGYSFTGINNSKSPWSNIYSNTYTGSRQELYNDIPPEYSRNYISSDVWADYSTPAWNGNLNVQMWPNKGYNWWESGIYGWGYFTALPGINPPSLTQTVFEDARYYVSLVHIYGSGIKNYTIDSIVDRFMFWRLDTGARLPSIGTTYDSGIIYPAYSVKAYRRTYPDYGLRSALKTIYTTSTFYKHTDSNTFTRPCIVYTDTAVRVAVKIAIKQKAWLEFARKLFIENVDFDQVRLLLENAVDKDITVSSDREEDLYLQDTNHESVFYHYWIEKAIDLFNRNNGKSIVTREFDIRINYLNSFISQTAGLISTVSRYWSYNGFLSAYNYLNALYYNVMSSNPIIEEYFYSYLNVLYEYRKYFINKRCNKQDGTFWKMRQLEGVVPMVASNLYTQDIKYPTNVESLSTVPIHQYRVVYYEVQNSNLDKARAIVDTTKYLEPDRTSVIYIKVEYVDESDAINYLNDLMEGKTNSETQKIIYIPNKGYAKLPFDDTYIYLSKEFSRNKKNLQWNEKCDKVNRPEKKKEANADIKDCVFPVKWNKYGALSIWNITDPTTKDAKEKLSLTPKYDDTGKKLVSHYPYVYRQTPGFPTITFDVVTGVDTFSPNSSVINELATTFDDKIQRQYIENKDLSFACTGFQYSDYWRIVLPTRPLELYYKNNLKIKTYTSVSQELSDTQIDGNPGTGVFGYMLYPIIEQQTHDYIGAGFDMQAVASNISSLHT